MRFIKDLHDFCSSLEYEFPSAINKDHDDSLSSNGENGFDNVVYSTGDSIEEYANDILQNLDIKGEASTNQTNESDVFMEIPFISQVSYYINQIKLECKGREQYRKSLLDEIYI